MLSLGHTFSICLPGLHYVFDGANGSPTKIPVDKWSKWIIKGYFLLIAVPNYHEQLFINHTDLRLVVVGINWSISAFQPDSKQ